MVVRVGRRKNIVDDKTLIGTRWGRLVAVSEKAYLPNKTGDGTSLSVQCQCDCGSSPKWIILHNLKRSLTRSCGCLRTESSSKRYKVIGRTGRKFRKYTEIESIARDLYSKYIKRKPGNLSFEEFYCLTKQDCHYCGCAPYQKYKNYGAKKHSQSYTGEIYTYNGLDRKNNDEPYNIDNVLPCCGICNRMKLNMKYEQFINHLHKIIGHLK